MYWTVSGVTWIWLFSLRLYKYVGGVRSMVKLFFRVKISSREHACLLRFRLSSVMVPPWPERRVCVWGEEVLMLRWCLHLTVHSADCPTLRKAGWDLGGLFCNGAVRRVSLVQIDKVSGTLKGQNWDVWGEKDVDRLPSQVAAMRRMVVCDAAILHVSSQEFNYDWKSFDLFMQQPLYFSLF